jgi:hypothetical protein
MCCRPSSRPAYEVIADDGPLRRCGRQARTPVSSAGTCRPHARGNPRGNRRTGDRFPAARSNDRWKRAASCPLLIREEVFPSSRSYAGRSRGPAVGRLVPSDCPLPPAARLALASAIWWAVSFGFLPNLTSRAMARVRNSDSWTPEHLCSRSLTMAKTRPPYPPAVAK